MVILDKSFSHTEYSFFSRRDAESAKHTSLSLVCTIQMGTASDSDAASVSSAALRET